MRTCLQCVAIVNVHTNSFKRKNTYVYIRTQHTHTSCGFKGTHEHISTYMYTYTHKTCIQVVDLGPLDHIYTNSRLCVAIVCVQTYSYKRINTCILTYIIHTYRLWASGTYTHINTSCIRAYIAHTYRQWIQGTEIRAKLRVCVAIGSTYVHAYTYKHMNTCAYTYMYNIMHTGSGFRTLRSARTRGSASQLGRRCSVPQPLWRRHQSCESVATCCSVVCMLQRVAACCNMILHITLLRCPLPQPLRMRHQSRESVAAWWTRVVACCSALQHVTVRSIMSNCDAALFFNLCEEGTHLVGLLQRVAARCSALQHIWQRVAELFSVLQRVEVTKHQSYECVAVCVEVISSVLQCVAVCCSVLQCVAVCCSGLQWIVLCCSVSPCCSVLQCVALCCSLCLCLL